MKYKLNGITIDSEHGSSMLGIPPGTRINLRAGDYIEQGSWRFEARRTHTIQLDEPVTIQNKEEEKIIDCKPNVVSKGT